MTRGGVEYEVISENAPSVVTIRQVEDPGLT